MRLLHPIQHVVGEAIRQYLLRFIPLSQTIRLEYVHMLQHVHYLTIKVTHLYSSLTGKESPHSDRS